jgi:hypothetical protein
MAMMNSDFIFAVAAITELLTGAWELCGPGLAAGSMVETGKPYSVTWGPNHEVMLELCPHGEMYIEVSEDMPHAAMYTVLGYALYHEIATNARHDCEEAAADCN